VAVDTMMAHCRHLKYDKKIYVITDAASPIDEDDLQQIADAIVDQKIEVSFMCVPFNQEVDINLCLQWHGLYG